MANSNANNFQRPSTIAAKLHRYTHATAEELITTYRDAGWLNEEPRDSIHRVCHSCGLCAESGFPKSSKKVSLTHVNEAFNQEVQLDFTFCNIRDTKYTVLHLVDTGTGYSEATITSSCIASAITRTFETPWIHRHGAPLAVSADEEMNNKPCTKLFDAHSIQYKPRPSGRHNKIGIVERKNGTLKLILERLQKENTRAPDDTILSRAVFLSNYFSGSRILSSFELAHGYAPSILGVPSTNFSPELLSAHKQQIATRALQRLLRSRAPSTIQPSCITPGGLILFHYRSTKHNETDEWREGIVQSVHAMFVETRRSHRGPVCRIAYEDIRLLPTSHLTKNLWSARLTITSSRQMGER